jgi:hypothetical protein
VNRSGESLSLSNPAVERDSSFSSAILKTYTRNPADTDGFLSWLALVLARCQVAEDSLRAARLDLFGKELTSIRVETLHPSIRDVVGTSAATFPAATSLRETLTSLGIDPATTQGITRSRAFARCLSCILHSW